MTITYQIQRPFLKHVYTSKKLLLELMIANGLSNGKMITVTLTVMISGERKLIVAATAYGLSKLVPHQVPHRARETVEEVQASLVVPLKRSRELRRAAVDLAITYKYVCTAVVMTFLIYDALYFYTNTISQ